MRSNFHGIAGESVPCESYPLREIVPYLLFPGICVLYFEMLLLQYRLYVLYLDISYDYAKTYFFIFALRSEVMLSGEPPFYGRSNDEAWEPQGDVWQHVTPSVKQLVQRMLSSDPQACFSAVSPSDEPQMLSKEVVSKRF